MTVFEHAMKMEEDGRAFYLEQAGQTDNPELKKLLLELADDELKHFRIFRAMRDNTSVDIKMETSTAVLTSVKNVFETFKAENRTFDFDGKYADGWVQARTIEAEAEKFYRQQADTVDNPVQKEMLLQIADEEHRHYVMIDHVVQFISRPGQWLEDAEWSQMDE